MKLPEPAHRGPDGTGGYFDSYTEAQMRQAIRDAFEEAAKVCEKNWQSTSADEIRKLKETI